MRTAVALGTGALAWVLSGCASTSCTMIGAESGVSVLVPGRSSQHLPRVEVCAEGRCATARWSGPSQLWATIDTIRTTDPVDVEVKLAGRPAVTSRVTPTRTQPNGPGCDPVAFQASVTLPTLETPPRRPTDG